MGPGSQDKTGAPRDKDHTSVIKEGCLEEGSEKVEPSPCPLFVGVCGAVHTCGRADPRGHTSQTRAQGETLQVRSHCSASSRLSPQRWV